MRQEESEEKKQEREARGLDLDWDIVGSASQAAVAAYEREESEKKNGNKTSGERLGKCMELVEKIIQKDYF